MRSRRGSAKRGMLRGRANASRRGRRGRWSWRRRRSCGCGDGRRLCSRMRWRSYCCRRLRRSNWDRRNGRGCFGFGRSPYRNGWRSDRRLNDGRRNWLALRLLYNFRDCRLCFFFLLRGYGLRDLLNRRSGREIARRRSDDRFHPLLFSRSRYLDGLGLNRRTHGLRPFVGRFCSRGRRCYLALQLQQFTMQGIALLGVQLGQILQLQTKFILLPGAEPNCGQSEHDTNRGLAQG